MSLSTERFSALPTSEALETKDVAESTEVGWDCSDLELCLEETGPRDWLEAPEDLETRDSPSEDATEAVGELPWPTFRLGAGEDITPFQWCRIDCLSNLAIMSVLKNEVGSWKSKTFGGLSQDYPSAARRDT